MKQRWVGQRGNERAHCENLQNQQQIFSEEPAEPRSQRALLQHPLPQKERGGAYLESFRFETVEEENERDSPKQKQQSIWHTPKHISRHAAHLA